jgi:hypothetical protein
MPDLLGESVFCTLTHWGGWEGLGEWPGHRMVPFSCVVPNSLVASVLLCCICHIRVVCCVAKTKTHIVRLSRGGWTPVGSITWESAVKFLLIISFCEVLNFSKFISKLINLNLYKPPLRDLYKANDSVHVFYRLLLKNIAEVYSCYGGETDISLDCGCFYRPFVHPQMRMSEGVNEWKS